MSSTAPAPKPLRPPLAYQASFEKPEEDEEQTAQELVATMRSISETTLKDSGHATRSVHAKSHGLIEGELRVLDGLPFELAQGIFATAGNYPVVMRFSTIPGDLLDDNVSTPRGLAIKIIGVEGERLPGAEGTTQDLVLVNGPAFAAPTAKGFLKNLKQLAATTDKAPGLKQALSATLQAAEKVVEAFGGKSGKLISMGGHPETNVLGETYFTQAPLLHGQYVAKLSVAPVSKELVALTNAKVDLDDKPNGLRDAVVDFFRTHGGEWEVRTQLCRDLDSMPIEDSSVPWPEDESPYIAVARIVAKPQTAWSAARSAAVDDGLMFSPWHGIAAHRPIGSVMRVRKIAYEMGRSFRSNHNRVSIEEPGRDFRLPDQP